MVIIFDVAQSRSQLETLRKETSAPAFWDDQERARRTMAHLSRLESEVSLYDRIMAHISELQEMNGLGLEEQDASFETEIQSGLDSLDAELSQIEFATLLQGGELDLAELGVQGVEA